MLQDAPQLAQLNLDEFYQENHQQAPLGFAKVNLYLFMIFFTFQKSKRKF